MGKPLPPRRAPGFETIGNLGNKPAKADEVRALMLVERVASDIEERRDRLDDAEAGQAAAPRQG